MHFPFLPPTGAFLRLCCRWIQTQAPCTFWPALSTCSWWALPYLHLGNWEVPKTSRSSPLGHKLTPLRSSQAEPSCRISQPDSRSHFPYASTPWYYFAVSSLLDGWKISSIVSLAQVLSVPIVRDYMLVVKFALTEKYKVWSSIKPQWEKQLLPRTLGTIWEIWIWTGS